MEMKKRYDIFDLFLATHDKQDLIEHIVFAYGKTITNKKERAELTQELYDALQREIQND